MTIWLKQSTAIDIVVGPFIDDTDGKTVETALSITQADCLLSKNAGSFAAKNSSTSASHLTQGMYKVPLNTTDTNTLGMLTLVINETGALPVWADFMIVPANTWDSLFGSDYLDVSLVQVSGSNVSTSTAQLGVNVVSAGGTAWASGAITAASIATDAITAAELSADAVGEIADAVWDEARSGHVAAGSFGEGVASVQGNVTGSVSGTVGSIGTSGITASTFGAGAITASAIATDAITAAELSADAIDEILDEVVEGTVTLRQAIRILLAAAANKSSGGGTTSITFRDLADTKARISATVDANGNRTAVTVDGS